MSFLQALGNLITGSEPRYSSYQGAPKRNRRDLIRLESRIGSQLFGAIPKGHRREFFCLDKHTWIWYEEWIDQTTRKKRTVTTRYEIHDNGIIKTQDEQPYQVVEGQELYNLVTAMRLYYEHVSRSVYHHDPYTGKQLSLIPS